MSGETPKDDQETTGPSSRLFQINEEDLAELERILPVMYDRAAIQMQDTRSRKMVEKVMRIVQSVRWNYAPWTNIETLPAGDGPES